MANENPHTYTNFFCNLKIKGKQIASSNIVSLVIREWIFDLIPRIELIINDDGVLTELFPLQDGDIISVVLGKNEKDPNPLMADFYLMAHTAGSMHGSMFMQIMMVGILKIDDFYSPIKSRSFKLKNSVDVLRQIISFEGKHIFEASTSTNDLMTWLQVQQNNFDMVKHVLNRSYKPNDCTFLYAYDSAKSENDTTIKFMYTSLQTQLSKKEFGTARYDIEKYSAEAFNDNIDYNNLWFNSYNIFDFTSYVNRINNYGIKYNYYLPSFGEKNINLNDDSHPLSDLTNKNKNNKNQITDAFNYGYQSKNVFENYYKAIAQNKYYKYNFFSSILELNINALCKPKLFNKINANVPSLINREGNIALSGEYLIIGITHEIGVGNIYRKRIACSRNGINSNLFIK
jgi:hypothetical protein